ncbi:hypothetical protein LINPERHAP2_LOCUS13493 [Linum perenne]
MVKGSDSCAAESGSEAEDIFSPKENNCNGSRGSVDIRSYPCSHLVSSSGFVHDTCKSCSITAKVYEQDAFRGATRPQWSFSRCCS